jgi:hypothetical protein
MGLNRQTVHDAPLITGLSGKSFKRQSHAAHELSQREEEMSWPPTELCFYGIFFTFLGSIPLCRNAKWRMKLWRLGLRSVACEYN